MKRLLSYIYPVTKTIPSKYNGDLEITWFNGKKHLNSKNANYSYGSLQRILKFGLEKIDVKSVKSTLVLGLGGGSIIQTLKESYNYTKNIEAVEIDPIIIEIAKSEFDIVENKHLKIHCADAFDFMLSNKKTFDLIIVDLYIDLLVPDKFHDFKFWETVLTAKSSKGHIIFNASVNTDEPVNNIKRISSFLSSKVYTTTVYENVNNTNTIIIASGL